MRSLLAVFFIFVSNYSFSQSQTQIKQLLNKVSLVKNSKDIIKSKEAKKLISYGKPILLSLAFNFTDDTNTNVISECQERTLTKGEIAMIIADHINRMPYATLTGVQNCTITFCENNPNFIEYYFSWLKEYPEKVNFRNKYITYISTGEVPITYKL